MSKRLSLLVWFAIQSILLAACGADPATPTGISAPAPTNTIEVAAPASTMQDAAPTNTTAAAQPTNSPAGGTGSGNSQAGGALTVYSGRAENLVGPLIEKFEQQTGIDVSVRYGDTAEMAATILEEGANTPADVYYAQDAGALGSLAAEGRLAQLPEATLSKVEARFRSPEGRWVGTSGRARVVVYNTQKLSESDLPASILDFTDPKWKGRLGWAPTNGSFQAHVTAMRVKLGEDQTRSWLEGIKANEPKVYRNNTAILEAVASGEIDAGFVNHYYLHNLRKERGDLAAANYYTSDGDVGTLINVAGVAIVEGSKNRAAAERFVEFLLAEEAQQYFAEQTSEYPLVPGVPAGPELKPLSEIRTPDIDLSSLADLRGTLQLLQELGIL